MLKNEKSMPRTSSMTVHRMRYRGPIESYKKNKLTKDVVADILALEEKIRDIETNLKTFIDETLNGNDESVAICRKGEEIFNGVDCIQIGLLNNDTTDILKKEVRPSGQNRTKFATQNTK